MPTFKEMTQYFQDVGANDIPHTKKTYLAHGIGVYRDMKDWGGDEDMCKAALFHSIYGTQQFQGFTLPLERREELQAFIGKRAEWIAFLNCFMDRATMDEQVTEDKEVYPIRHRETGEMIDVSRKDFDDLVRLHLCDMLEQVERSNAWDTRREAFRNMAERLGGVALEAYESGVCGRACVDEMVKRIAIIGNAGGGKTTLARRLAEIYDLEVTHVDGVQFLAGFERRPEEETREILNAKADEDAWVIDGFGSLDVIEHRFRLADAIVYIDFPIWRHYWWVIKRQVKAYWETRSELPEGCSEKGLSHTLLVFKVVRYVHQELGPELTALIDQWDVGDKVVWVRSMSDWKRVYKGEV